MSKLDEKLFDAELYIGYKIEEFIHLIIRVLCYPLGFPIGILNNFIPIDFCDMDSSVYERENEIISSSLQPPSLLETIAQSDGSIMNNIERETTIERVSSVINRTMQVSSKTISASQNITVICDNTYLENNKSVYYEADVELDGIWLPAKAIPTETSGNSIKEYTVKFKKSGDVERNVPVERVRFIYGCCPTTNQKITIETADYSNVTTDTLSEINDEINSSVITALNRSKCSGDDLKAITNIMLQNKIKDITFIENIFKQASRQNLSAEQNIIYYDAYQMCDEGKPRVLNQLIDIKAISQNIVDSKVKLLQNTAVSEDISVENTIVRNAPTARIYVFALLLNVMIIYSIGSLFTS
jgi:hypothetical protein